MPGPGNHLGCLVPSGGHLIPGLGKSGSRDRGGTGPNPAADFGCCPAARVPVGIALQREVRSLLLWSWGVVTPGSSSRIWKKLKWAGLRAWKPRPIRRGPGC